MPSHKVHIGIGQEVNKELRLDNDLFYIGCIMPDLGKKYFVSHFKKNPREYDIDEFVKTYYDKDNPVIVGYLVHLLTDDYYNRYTRENKFLFDKNYKLNGIKMVNKYFFGTPEEATSKKQEGFYDYEYYLLNNKVISKLNYINLEDLPLINECEIDTSYIKEYIDTHNKVVESDKNKPKYEVFSFEELDELYKNSIKYIKKYLHKLNKEVEKPKKLYYN